jgi:hypothetical protein
VFDLNLMINCWERDAPATVPDAGRWISSPADDWHPAIMIAIANLTASNVAHLMKPDMEKFAKATKVAVTKMYQLQTRSGCIYVALGKFYNTNRITQLQGGAKRRGNFFLDTAGPGYLAGISARLSNMNS